MGGVKSSEAETVRINNYTNNTPTTNFTLGELVNSFQVATYKASIASGYYTFSGGGIGTVADPFVIKTANDLVMMSYVVNNKKTYKETAGGTDKNYAEANYVLGNDIDMSETVSGPFIKISKKIERRSGGSADDWQIIYDEDIIVKSKTNTAPYTCDPVYQDKTNTTTISLANSSAINNTCNKIVGGYNGSANSGGIYRFTITYSVYSADNITYSNLFQPIGVAIKYNGNVDYNASVIFQRSFNGKGYSIYNLNIAMKSTAAGLLGFVSNTNNGSEGTRTDSKIQNINIVNSNIVTGSNSSSGGIVGLLGSAIVENCSLINSSVSGGAAAGGIVGEMTRHGVGSTNNGISDGRIFDCQSFANNITATLAGGIAGNVPDTLTFIKNNSTASNTVNGTQTGVFVPGVINPDNGILSGNENITEQSVSIESYRDKILFDGIVPDYCYINRGIAFDPENNVSDKIKLEKLSKELKGDTNITENIVLPDTTGIVAALNQWRSLINSSASTALGKTVVFTNDEGGTHISAREEMENGNFYVYDNEVGWKVKKYTTDYDRIFYRKKCGFSIIIDGVQYFYRYRCDTTTTTPRQYIWSFTKEVGTGVVSTAVSGAKYKYYYRGWDGYSEEQKNAILAEYLQNVNNQEQYYKLTATNPIVDISSGGGLYDKGEQLNGKTVQFRKRLNLEKWNFLGILGVSQNAVYNNKVNFLYNTDNSAETVDSVKTKHNDMAADGFNYKTNDWDSTYLVSTTALPFGQGIFVWPFNTAYNDTVEIFTKNPILTQTGTVSDFNTIGDNATTYLKQLNNTSTSEHKYFSLANPFTCDMSVPALIKNLSGGAESGVITGNKIYVYHPNALGEGQWIDNASILKAGEAFIVEIAGGRSSFAGVENTQLAQNSLLGYNYTPTSSSKILSINGEEFRSFEFIAIDDLKNVTRLSATCQDNAQNGIDNYDASVMFSEGVSQPYFLVNNSGIKDNHFFTLPYEVPLNIHAERNDKVLFNLICLEKENIFVYLMDAEQDTIIRVMNNQEPAYLDVTPGENEGKYKIAFSRKQIGLESVVDKNIDIIVWNNNRDVYVSGKDLKYIEVYNTLGQRIYERSISGEEFNFTLNAISGAYIVKIRNSEGTSTKKIVIK